MRNFFTTGLFGSFALGLVLFSTAPASAFYWYGWPGSGSSPPHTVTNEPPSSGTGTPPSVPIGTPSGESNPPPGGGGATTPEPATGLAAIAGLGVVTAARAVRRRLRDRDA